MGILDGGVPLYAAALQVGTATGIGAEAGALMHGANPLAIGAIPARTKSHGLSDNQQLCLRHTEVKTP